MKGNKYGAYENFTRKDLLAKIDDLEAAHNRLALRVNQKCNCAEKDRIIRNIADYANLPLKYRTPYNCGRTG